MGKNDSYYRGGSFQREKKRRRFSLADLILFPATVVVCLLLATAYFAQWIDPHHFGILALIGLILPILYIACTLCLLYWVIRWKKFALFPLAILIIGFFGIGLFFRPQFKRTYNDPSEKRDRTTVRTVSYNVMGMMKRENNRLTPRMSTFGELVDSLKPDILCLQEFQSTVWAPKSTFEAYIPDLKYNVIRYKVGDSGSTGWGLALYSRYPILHSGYFDFENTTNSALWADVKILSDTLRIFNVHLQTTSISATDQDFITSMNFVRDSTRSEKFRNMFQKLKRNYVIRASQADSIAPLIAASPYPVIVCGDFNDTPMSYTYHRMRGKLADSFREAGHGLGYTYRGFFRMLRIDYILHSSDRIRTVNYFSPDFDCSDHNPVAVDLKIATES